MCPGVRIAARPHGNNRAEEVRPSIKKPSKFIEEGVKAFDDVFFFSGDSQRIIAVGIVQNFRGFSNVVGSQRKVGRSILMGQDEFDIAPIEGVLAPVAAETLAAHCPGNVSVSGVQDAGVDIAQTREIRIKESKCTAR